MGLLIFSKKSTLSKPCFILMAKKWIIMRLNYVINQLILDNLCIRKAAFPVINSFIMKDEKWKCVMQTLDNNHHHLVFFIKEETFKYSKNGVIRRTNSFHIAFFTIWISIHVIGAMFCREIGFEDCNYKKTHSNCSIGQRVF